jgi:hypothetical protein
MKEMESHTEVKRCKILSHHTSISSTLTYTLSSEIMYVTVVCSAFTSIV